MPYSRELATLSSKTSGDRILSIPEPIQKLPSGELSIQDASLISELMIRGLQTQVEELKSEVVNLKQDKRGLEEKNKGLEEKNKGFEEKNKGLEEKNKGLEERNQLVKDQWESRYGQLAQSVLYLQGQFKSMQEKQSEGPMKHPGTNQGLGFFDGQSAQPANQVPTGAHQSTL